MIECSELEKKFIHRLIEYNNEISENMSRIYRKLSAAGRIDFLNCLNKVYITSARCSNVLEAYYVFKAKNTITYHNKFYGK